ncbi:MAG: hypothetical protein QOH21_3385 [Acidobacteriota bacterium]|nr:hypothetical protein [Acidobacteriota bacterium]
MLGLFAIAVTMAAAEVPPLPALPPAEMEARLFADPSQIPPVLRSLGQTLMTSDAALRGRVETYAAAMARARAARVPADLRIVTAFLVVDPLRYTEDAAFRARVDALMPRMLTGATPRATREAALAKLNAGFPIEYATADAIAAAWGLTPRASAARKTTYSAKQRFLDDTHGTIEATIVSLGSEFFTAEDAKAFLASLRASAPARRILVLADPPMREALRDLPVDMIDTYGRPFTPWPRDPFTVTRTPEGRVVFVDRPNLQPNREDDANMVRALVQGLPASLDTRWKEPRWTVAPFPFHNGHVLVMPDAAWISIHTVEIRALQILGIDRVPVSTFNTAAGIARYVTAVRQAAKELETLYGRAVRFVHPLPSPSEPLAKQVTLMQSLGGGGGFDLDSIVTLLPSADGKLHALVGDITAGATLARKADWTAAYRAYGFTGERATLGRRVAEAQDFGRAPGLQHFLDTVAAYLAARNVIVERIPLLDVPYALLTDPAALNGSDFLITWHNVVLEKKHAAGFASLLPEGDAAARAAFTRAGYHLDLLAPLVRSIVLNGGYRCASNHVRK